MELVRYQCWLEMCCVVVRCLVLSCLLLSCLLLSCLLLSWLVSPCPNFLWSCDCVALSWFSFRLGLSCLVKSCLALSCFVLSCLAFSCLVLTCPVLSRLFMVLRLGCVVMSFCFPSRKVSLQEDGSPPCFLLTIEVFGLFVLVYLGLSFVVCLSFVLTWYLAMGLFVLVCLWFCLACVAIVVSLIFVLSCDSLASISSLYRFVFSSFCLL